MVFGSRFLTVFHEAKPVTWSFWTKGCQVKGLGRFPEANGCEAKPSVRIHFFVFSFDLVFQRVWHGQRESVSEICET